MKPILILYSKLKLCEFYNFYSTVVLGAYQNEALLRFSSICVNALRLIGGKRPFQLQYQASFAIVGYKGNTKPTWIQQKKSDYGKGPTDLNGAVSLF